jgi:hypothetical protein
MSTTTITPPVPNAIIPPPCAGDDLPRRLDWRMRLANDLAATATEDPVDGDFWVQDAARLLYRTRLKDASYTPTFRQHCIVGAARLYRTGSLAIEALEARLLAGIAFDRIDKACTYPASVIEAYASMFFDVSGLNGKGRWLLGGMHENLNRDPTIRRIGSYLKQIAVCNGWFALQGAIFGLSILEGPTLGDDLGLPNFPEYEDAVLNRLGLGAYMVRSARRAKEFRDSAVSYQKKCDIGFAPEVPAITEMLTSVKLSKKVLEQCRELRRPDQIRYA